MINRYILKKNILISIQKYTNDYDNRPSKTDSNSSHNTYQYQYTKNKIKSLYNIIANIIDNNKDITDKDLLKKVYHTLRQNNVKKHDCVNILKCALNKCNIKMSNNEYILISDNDISIHDINDDFMSKVNIKSFLQTGLTVLLLVILLGFIYNIKKIYNIFMKIYDNKFSIYDTMTSQLAEKIKQINTNKIKLSLGN